MGNVGFVPGISVSGQDAPIVVKQRKSIPYAGVLPVRQEPCHVSVGECGVMLASALELLRSHLASYEVHRRRSKLKFPLRTSAGLDDQEGRQGYSLRVAETVRYSEELEGPALHWRRGGDH